MRALRMFFGLLMVVALFLCTGCGDAGLMRSPAKDANRRAMAPAADDGDFFGEGTAEVDEAPAQYADAAGVTKGEPPASPAPTEARPKPADTAHDGTTSDPVQKTAPLLIYTANYRMAVYEVTQSIDEVQALAKKMGGYLVRRDNRSITIRVPAKKYHTALGDISKLGDVLHHEETVDDVTEQFFDMKTRLDNARAMRVRLQELLAAAKDVNDALAVEKELARVTDTIERLEGKLKRLRELINFSTITVEFAARGGENVNSKVNLPFPWLGELGLGPLLQLR